MLLLLLLFLCYSLGQTDGRTDGRSVMRNAGAAALSMKPCLELWLKFPCCGSTWIQAKQPTLLPEPARRYTMFGTVTFGY